MGNGERIREDQSRVTGRIIIAPSAPARFSSAGSAGLV